MSDARYEAERIQGEAVASADADGVWGWSTPAGRLRADRRSAFIRSAAGLGPGVECLELGAGTGVFTERIAESGCKLTALEISHATADVCRKRLGSRAEVVVGNAETGEGVEDRRFDAMVGVSVLHHLDLDSCFESTLSKLRADGLFAFSEPNMANPQIWAERNVRWIGRRRHTLDHETAFRQADLRRRFERHGFEVSVCEPFDFLHPATPERMVRFIRRVESRLERTPLGALAGSIRIAGRKIA